MDELGWNSVWKDDSSSPYLFSAYHPLHRYSSNDMNIIHRTISEAWLDSTKLIACDVIRSAVDDVDDVHIHENEMEEEIPHSIASTTNSSVNSNSNSETNSEPDEEKGEILLPDNNSVEEPWSHSDFFMNVEGGEENKQEHVTFFSMNVPQSANECPLGEVPDTTRSFLSQQHEQHEQHEQQHNRKPMKIGWGQVKRRKSRSAKMARHNNNNINNDNNNNNNVTMQAQKSEMQSAALFQKSPSTVSSAVSTACVSSTASSGMVTSAMHKQRQVHCQHQQGSPLKGQSKQSSSVISKVSHGAPPPSSSSSSSSSSLSIASLNSSSTSNSNVQLSIRPGVNTGTGVFQPLAHLMQKSKTGSDSKKFYYES